MPGEREPKNGMERLRSGVGASGSRILFNDEFPFRYTDIDFGLVSVACEFDDLMHSVWELSPLGVIAACGDVALGGVIGTVLDREHLSITLQLNVDAARPFDPDIRGFSCRATLLDVGPDIGLARAEMFDHEGRLIAQSSLRAAVTKVRRESRTPEPTATAVRDLTPPSAEGDSRADQGQDGLTSMILRYLQAAVVAESENDLEVTVIPTAVMANSVSMVHGGAVGLLAGIGGALTAARRLSAPPAREVGLDIAFFAATRVETPTTLRGSVVHKTKRVATVEGEIRDQSDRLTASFRQLWQCAPA